MLLSLKKTAVSRGFFLHISSIALFLIFHFFSSSNSPVNMKEDVQKENSGEDKQIQNESLDFR